MCLKLNRQKNQFSTMKPTIIQVLLFHTRSVYPFSVVQILNPYHVEFVLMLCVCREGGCFDVIVFCNAVYSKFELKPKQNLEEYFHRQHI